MNVLLESQDIGTMPQALTHARCLVWQAQLYALPIQGVNTPLFDEEEGTFLHWDIHLHSIESSHDWLPLDYRYRSEERRVGKECA